MMKFLRDVGMAMPLTGRERLALFGAMVVVGYVAGTFRAERSSLITVAPAASMRLVKSEDDCKDNTLAVERVNSDFLVCIGEPK